MRRRGLFREVVSSRIYRTLASTLLIVGMILPPLAWSDDPINIDTEKSRLIKGHPAEQQAAIIRLANAGEAGADALVDIIENEKDGMAKARAGRSLQEAAKRPENRNKRFFQKVKRLADNQNASVSERGLLTAMNMKSDPEARKLLRELAKSKTDPQLRAKTLGMLLVNTERDKAEVPFLAEFLNDPSEYVRVWAAGYLGELGDRRRCPSLTRFFSASRTTTRRGIDNAMPPSRQVG